MHAQRQTASKEQHKARHHRVLMFFVMLFLALQLIGASQHKHVYTDSQSDCAACAIAHLPAGVPPPAAVVLAVAILVSVVVIFSQRSAQPPTPNYLTPPAHAPPAR